MQQYFFETIQYDKHIPARIVVGYETLSDSFARMHWHREIELFYMINGHASFEGMGLTTTLESDGLILFNSEEPHRMFQNESNRLTQYLVLHLSYDYAKEFDDNIDSTYFKLNHCAETALKSLLRELIRLTENRRNDAYVDLEKKACVIKIYHELFSKCRMEKRVRFIPTLSNNTGRIKTVIKYVGEHYRDDISRDEMAALVGLTPAYFSQYFKAVTEVTFTQYLSCLRMERALSDLVSMDISVMDAALQNGFANVRSFTSVCKRVFGMTPMQLKKRRMRDEF